LSPGTYQRWLLGDPAEYQASYQRWLTDPPEYQASRTALLRIHSPFTGASWKNGPPVVASPAPPRRQPNLDWLRGRVDEVRVKLG
jgi:hypothetical protein